ncbi:diaminopimelate epimerase [Pukyongia salina]|uniref:Diaminopimelate epimerase n=1 Tax=Pukyongia salina TaxID=2094025 RepID=A0A2S0HY37_9FLAO|nr:diaminopimelate epimerase [Pukyongia salina]AVI51535.1 diaminopimelate epimerase [Pukyongia salina]
MAIEFYKYQGTGNDFIIIDNRLDIFPKNNTKQVALMCDRKFGIGADGLILLEHHAQADFRMVYYNSDGKLSSMCGNGGRCIAHFAKSLGIIENSAVFEAVDGMHEATVENKVVSLHMNDVREVIINNDFVFLDTGSPHHVSMVDDLSEFNVFQEGRRIRNQVYGEAGANVNFVQKEGDSAFSVRTYERGVEDETLSCGTGVTAVALAMHATGETSANEVSLRTPGGDLKVKFSKKENGYTDIYLIGPAVQVYKGEWA